MGRNSGTDILYMPAVHQGYVNYLGERNGEVGILDEALVGEVPRLDRDIRAMGSELVVQLVRVVVPERHIILVTLDNLDEFLSCQHLDQALNLPNEDVSHTFVEHHVPTDYEISYHPTFLRWDKRISTAESLVFADRVTSDPFDRALMRIAEEEARLSRDWWRQVGAIIYSEKRKLLLQGHNHPVVAENYTLETLGDPRSNFDAGQNIDLQKNIHAEVGVIAEAARRGIALKGADLFVTTFPCPVCAKSVAEAGIKRVYFKDGYSLLDAMDIFKTKGIEVIQVVDELPNAS